MMLVELTAPAADALPVAALRDHLRLGAGFEIADDPAEAAALAGFLRAAIATIEARTGKVLLARQFRMRLDDWRDPTGQPLPFAPVSAIDQVEIDSGAGQVVSVDPASWRLLADMQRPALMPKGMYLPVVPDAGFVTVTFRAGFGTSWNAVPADLAHAVLLLAARYYEDRSYEGSQAAMPFGVSALIERWRSVRVLGGRSGMRRRA
ncbi:head-tail connector protein [Paracoccus aestuariivivens]|uniref:Phage gp6-like head-tail connector protein n=1 Tax=Paracoccus aestuariivivens TaxID=1820333 RepID=A0A6L6J524_9RHOB|nr:phage head-tail connector protein [Paracoccus aestuariivivens]MTH77202.1 hypothetical protein [Paracoccus aestuariivivens]